MGKPASLGSLTMIIGLMGCVEELPTAPLLGAPDAVMSQAGVDKVPVSGMLVSTAEHGPSAILMTPSGRCHFSDLNGEFLMTGDVEGAFTIRRRVVNMPCGGPSGPGERLTGSGPVDGVVTYDGRTGEMSGQWTTECRPDASEPTGWSCDGTMNFHGSGDLQGVQLQIRWGPGWWPFPYQGTLLSR